MTAIVQWLSIVLLVGEKMIGDQLRNRMILFGNPSCIDTAKCLQTAAEKGVDVEAKVIDITDDGYCADAEYLNTSPLTITPALKDVDFTVVGTPAILSYLDDKGFGPSLVPRNGVVRAIMYQWANVATLLVQKAEQSNDLTKVFAAFDKHLANPPKKGDYICGDFTLADIHWFSCINMLKINGQGDLITSNPKVNIWHDNVMKHPSTSKENIIPSGVLPTAEDVRNNSLRDISINV